MRKKSNKPIKTIESLKRPFRKVFEVSIEGSVNGNRFVFKKGKQYNLTYSEYEVIAHSSYARYLHD